ncbi:MAG: nucleoside recognition domain-containing protein [Eubacteriales bacterium]|jgi:spore maturation protein A|nr:nucleoside recognition domain-containing protein [Eubacteriales bacterium]
MINYIWGALMLISLVTAFFTGRLEAVTKAAMEGAGEAVSMSLSLLGVICLWTGMMKIAEEGGLINLFAKLLKPVIKFLFPGLPPNSSAADAIVMNMMANILGMANAATPLGLKAMKELDRLKKSSRASDEMCLFVVINTASLQLIPSTLIAMRGGSQNAFEIIIPVWIASFLTLTVGIIAAKILSLRE